jgi:hypothetical protein
MTTDTTVERDGDDVVPSTETNGRALAATNSTVLHGPTTCDCGEKGEHYEKSAMEATFASSPEKIYNLMFTSGFVKDFMVNDQHLTGERLVAWFGAVTAFIYLFSLT